jgi:hypothetical protein
MIIKIIKDRHSSKTPNLKSKKPFGFRNGITISNYKKIIKNNKEQALFKNT